MLPGDDHWSMLNRRRRSISVLLLQVLLVGLVPLALLVATATVSSALPAGFTERTLFDGLDSPVSVEFSADGRVLVAEKSGLIKAFDGFGDATPAVVADLSTQVYNRLDRGLLGMALAPAYPEDPYLYVLYARDAVVGGSAPRWGTPGVLDDPCPSPPGDNTDGCVVSGRLSRLDLSRPGGGPEQVLVDDWCQQFSSHSVGDLQFGPDGFLYATSGDGASFTFADYGQAGSPRNPCGDPPGGTGGAQTVPSAEGGALRAQDVQTLTDPVGLSGSVIRIDPMTGAGAPGNPMITSADPNARRLIGAGLRNPFRFTFRPGTSELWIGDVGWSTHEEINRLVGPTDNDIDNFGWPCLEGTATNGYNIGLALCDRVISGAVPSVAPHFSYRHGQPVVSGDGCSTLPGSSTSGVAFYEAGTYPDAYDGALFFGDYSRSCIWVMFPGPDGVPDPATRTVFRQGDTFPVDLTTGPNGDLYYVDIVAGAVKQIRFATGEQSPVAAMTATPAQGALPLSVSFTAAASVDPEGQPLTYAWDLDGDGQFDDATGVTAGRTYTVAGAYDVAVRVSDPGGRIDTASRRVLAGSTPPAVTIDSPGAGFTWAVGDDIAFSGSATDAEDGALPASALSWRVIMHHCVTIDACHEHDLTGFDGVASGVLPAPDHEYPSYLELRLTATDGSGIRSTATRRIDPKVGQVTVATSPPGLSATLSSITGAGPFTAQAIVGSRLSLSTPAQQSIGSSVYAFTGWSDGGPRVHDVFVGAASSTYSATFTRISGDDPALVAAYSFDEGSGTSLIDRTGKGHTGTLNGGTAPTWAPAAGHTGGALSFDGVDDLVTIADANALDLTTGLTVEAWLRPSAVTDYRTAVLKERPGGLAYALYGSGPGVPSGQIVSGAGVEHNASAQGGLAVDAWTHVAMTYDGAALRLYVNGNQVSATPANGALPTSAAPLRIGGNVIWGEYFRGLVDDVRVYNRALSASEILLDREDPVSGDSVAPSAVGGLTATGGAGSIQLSWSPATDNVGIVSYDVHRGNAATFVPSSTSRIETVTGTSYADTGLPVGTYFYKVLARDAAGNVGPPSAAASASATADTTAPTVAVTAPTAGSSVTGSVPFSATASDVGGVAAVQFRVDGVALGGDDVAAPYTTVWNSASVPNGSHVLTAVARDVAGNVTTSAPVTVTVANDSVPPQVAVTAPSAGSTVSGDTVVAASASDNTGVAGVQLVLDGAPLGAEDVVAPYTLTWDTTAVPNGAHTLSAVARDASGNSTTSAPVGVTVQNAAPSPSAPVAEYSFDEGTGSTLFDRSGRGNNGTVSGATWVAGRTGGALSFDGVDDLVSVADSTSLDLTAGLTVEAWVRPTTATSGYRTAVLKENGPGLAYALYGSGPNRPAGFVEVGGADRSAVAPSALTANTWTHLAMTYDGTTIRLYRNGTQVATRAQTGPVAVSSGALRLGGNTVWGEYLAGALDDVRIYARALTAAEVLADRDRPVVGDTEPPNPPGEVSATGGQGSVQLAWSPSIDNVAVTAYDVHRSTTPGFTVSTSTRVASVTSTSFVDSGLAAGTYHYRVAARDAAGNASGPSAAASVIVTSDTTAPAVSVTSPAAGAAVSGTVQVTATATDTGGIAGVQFRLDGQVLGAEDFAAPYAVDWLTSSVANGPHTLTAVARDAAGNTTTSAPVSVTVQNAAAAGPVAAYNFDEGAGTSLVDRTGKGHTGTIVGGTWSPTGRNGGALSFDGTDDLVTIADAADLDLTTAMTIEAWVRPTVNTGYRTVLLKERPGGLAYALYSGGGAGRASAQNVVGTAEGEATSATNLPLNAWSHLAATFDGTTLRLYVDGTQVSVRSISGPMVTSASPLRLGGNTVWGEYFTGLIDDVRVYGRVLTAAEITADRGTAVP